MSSRSCTHELWEAESAVTADGMCPLCLLDALGDERIARQAAERRCEGYQASRDWAIEELAKALGIEADKMRAIEYYARLASEQIAELEKDAEQHAVAQAKPT